MNRFDATRPSGPECARFSALLPRFRQGLLSPADDTYLRAHLATCAYCRAQLATFDRLDESLRRSIDRFAPTTPAADDLVRVAVAHNPLASSATMPSDQSTTPRMRQRETTMFDSEDTLIQQRTIPPRPRHPRPRPVLATIAALLLVGLTAALFAMFSRGSFGPGQTATPTATAVPTTPTATTTATPQPTQPSAPAVVNTGHPCSSDTTGQTTYVQIGDLKVSAVQFSLSYPSHELPASLDRSKPYQLPDNLPSPPNPPVNPPTSQGTGYSLTICNTSGSASHVIRGLTVGITNFVAYAGPLNSYSICEGWFTRPNMINGGGCGGGMTMDEQLQASFAADATTGAQVKTTQIDAPNAPPLPVSLGPGQMLVISFGLTPPTVAGSYTFAFGLDYDEVTAAPISTLQPILFDSAAVKWNGQNCTQPAMLSQIPTAVTNPPTNYICAP